MKGKRSKSNLYELQGGSGSLCYKSDDCIVCGSLKKVTFEYGKSVGLEGELLMQVPKLITLITQSNIPQFVLWRKTLMMCRVVVIYYDQLSDRCEAYDASLYGEKPCDERGKAQKGGCSLEATCKK